MVEVAECHNTRSAHGYWKPRGYTFHRDFRQVRLIGRITQEKVFSVLSSSWWFLLSVQVCCRSVVFLQLYGDPQVYIDTTFLVRGSHPLWTRFLPNLPYISLFSLQMTPCSV